jgi:hypothetical protein
MGFKGKPYITDSFSQSIVHEEKDGSIDQIRCQDPRFDNRVVFTLAEYGANLKRLQEIYNLCAVWKPEAKIRLYQLSDDLLAVTKEINQQKKVFAR